MGNRTTKDKTARNIVIKLEVQAELELGLSLKQAIYVVADRFYLSYSSVEKIYYDTRIPD